MPWFSNFACIVRSRCHCRVYNNVFGRGSCGCVPCLAIAAHRPALVGCSPACRQFCHSDRVYSRIAHVSSRLCVFVQRVRETKYEPVRVGSRHCCSGLVLADPIGKVRRDTSTKQIRKRANRSMVHSLACLACRGGHRGGVGSPQSVSILRDFHTKQCEGHRRGEESEPLPWSAGPSYTLSRGAEATLLLLSLLLMPPPRRCEMQFPIRASVDSIAEANEKASHSVARRRTNIVVHR